ncbi:MAG: ABC transporter ATP-binding protein [Thermoguttaceae bacterium]
MSLIVSHLRKTFPTCSEPLIVEPLIVLRDCSFELQMGESLSIIGPSGSGKSTLLGILGHLEPATSGEIRLNDINVLQLSESELPAFRRHHIGFIFQDHYLSPQSSALENVLIPFLSEGRITKERRERGKALLERVGLADRMSHRPAELSGGERQRVAIARSLVFAPTLILADEPTGNLDRRSADSVASLLLELQENTILVLATHDLALASQTVKKGKLDDGVFHAE